MAKYRVIGSKYQPYYSDVNASDKYQAYDIAKGLGSHEWHAIETDDVIEPVEVIEDDN
jgi:hypothetical protein